MNPKVAIIILNWNGWKDTIKCLESVYNLNYPNFEVIVVDNGSRDDSVKKIKKWVSEHSGKSKILLEYDRISALQGGRSKKEESLEYVSSNLRMILIKNEENLGYAGGNNVAIHYAFHKKSPSDYVFILNNDAEVDKHCLTHLIEVAGKTDAGVVGAVIMNKNGKGIHFEFLDILCGFGFRHVTQQKFVKRHLQPQRFLFK
jgi:GT2 family glycosyltransferase